MPPKLLIYTQDPGGTRCLMPVLQDWPRNFEGIKTTFIVHPLAEPIFRSFGYSRDQRRRVNFPLSVADWVIILQEEEATHLLTTLSATALDPSNVHLVEAARKNGVLSLGLMDHWKGYERFYDDQGKPRYFTDWLGCIDKFAFEEFRKRGIAEERLHIIGQPGLEKSMLQSWNPRGPHQTLKAVLVSQPDSRNGSYDSLFRRKRNDMTLLNLLASLCSGIGGSRLCYRPHPKEQPIGSLPEGLSFDETRSAEEAVSYYDLFIGVDSTLLFQARLAGKKCLILDIPELADEKDSIPYHIEKRVSSWEELPRVLREVIESPGQMEDDVSSFSSALKGSSDRCRKLIRRFLEMESHDV